MLDLKDCSQIVELMLYQEQARNDLTAGRDVRSAYPRRCDFFEDETVAVCVRVAYGRGIYRNKLMVRKRQRNGS